MTRQETIHQAASHVAMPSQPQWISVEDELPKCYKPYIDGLFGETTDIFESDKCLVLLANGDYTIATLNQDCDFEEETGTPTKEPYWFDECRTDDGDCISGEVTHWMPLPEPPVVRDFRTTSTEGGEQ